MKEKITRSDFYIDDHAVLFGLLAKHSDRILGKSGLDTLAQGVVTMARERGLRSAMRCDADGSQLTMGNYLCYAELLDDRSWNQTQVDSCTPVYCTRTLRCGWYDTWKKYGLEGYAPLYCGGIDANILYGFNPLLRLEMDQFLAYGDPCCNFRWIDGSFEDEAQRTAILEKRSKMLSHVTKDFLYHSGHLLSVMRRSLYLEYGLLSGRAVVEAALSEYATLFSSGKAEMIQAESEQNFLAV